MKMIMEWVILDLFLSAIRSFVSHEMSYLVIIFEFEDDLSERNFSGYAVGKWLQIWNSLVSYFV